jgi:hypothetical protein
MVIRLIIIKTCHFVLISDETIPQSNVIKEPSVFLIEMSNMSLYYNTDVSKITINEY